MQNSSDPLTGTEASYTRLKQGYFRLEGNFAESWHFAQFLLDTQIYYSEISKCSSQDLNALLMFAWDLWKPASAKFFLIFQLTHADSNNTLIVLNTIKHLCV